MNECMISGSISGPFLKYLKNKIELEKQGRYSDNSTLVFDKMEVESAYSDHTADGKKARMGLMELQHLLVHLAGNVGVEFLAAMITEFIMDWRRNNHLKKEDMIAKKTEKDSGESLVGKNKEEIEELINKIINKVDTGGERVSA